MKFKIALIAFLAWASAAFGATLAPVQLLNPAGSTSGQSIVSTGASSAPGWSAIVNSIAGQTGAVTLTGIGLGSTSTPTFYGATLNGSTQYGLVVGGGNGNPLTYTAAGTSGQPLISGGAAANPAYGTLGVTGGGTGLATITSHSILAGNGTSAISQIGAGTTGQVFVGSTGGFPAFGSTVGPLTFTGAITPSTTAGIVGTTLGDNANAGSNGEVLSNATTGTSLSTGVTANCASVPLTAGDWDVQGTLSAVPAGSTTVSQISAGISTTSATFATANTGATTFLVIGFTTGQTQIISTPVYRVNVSSSATAYLVSQDQFGVSTMTCNGFIRARRVR